MEDTRNERINAIDILRGFGIILMIMGHIGIGIESMESSFSKFYHAFHMPLFYTISGYFFHRSFNDNNFVYKKARSLLIPYLIFGLLFNSYYFITCTKYPYNLGQKIISSLIYSPIDQIPIAGALWFLPSLFWCNMIYFVILKMCRANKLFVIASSLIVCLIGYLLLIRGIHLPFAIDTSLVPVFLLCVGDCVWNVQHNTKLYFHLLHSYIMFLGAVILASLFTNYNDEVNFRIGIYGNIVLCIISALLWTFAFSILAIKCDEKVCEHINCIRQIFISIGKDSIVYLCLNQYIIMLILPLCVQILDSNSSYVNFIERIFCLVLTVIICYVFAQVVKSSCLLGKVFGKEKYRDKCI